MEPDRLHPRNVARKRATYEQWTARPRAAVHRKGLDGALSARQRRAMTHHGIRLLHRSLVGVLVLAPAAGVLAKPETHNRAEIPAQYRWDFSAIYPNWAAWETAMADMQVKMDAFAAMKGTLKNGPAAVLKAYQAFDEIGILQYKVYRYPGLQRDVDTTIRTSRENFNALAPSSRSLAPRRRGSRPSC